MPYKLRFIRNHLLGSNSFEHLMLWSAMILGSKLFLRIDKVVSLQVESFLVKHYFLIEEREVVALMLKVKDKTDVRHQHFLV